VGVTLTDISQRDPAAVNGRMLELASKFIARTTDDLKQMREALARHGSPGFDNGSGLEQIRQLAHRACGTGGTLGLLALSDAAGELELLIDALPDGASLGAADRERIAAGIDAIASRLVPL
jgi:HPt (histidine-containing phosphotransfer) domain-containing protein